jgi:hypothetical protein
MRIAVATGAALSLASAAVPAVPTAASRDGQMPTTDAWERLKAPMKRVLGDPEGEY